MPDTNNVANVTAGKPRTGGAVFSAPVGTALPAAADSELDAAFAGMGYISEDGLTNSNSPESDSIRAWGGDTVLNIQTAKEDTFGFTMIEALNVNVLKAVYGSGNVTGTLEDGITVTANSAEQEERSWVVDEVLRNGVLSRTVIPRAKITELGEISHTDSEAMGYEVTLGALPDAAGNTHYTYYKAPAAAP